MRPGRCRIAADPDVRHVAHLLGWTELGHGTAADGAVRIGHLVLRGAAAPDLTGPVHAFYRPEDIEIGPVIAGTPPGAAFTARVKRIVPTRPLARISLGPEPQITALILHRDLGCLQLAPGEQVQATLPHSSLRIFRGR